MPTPRRLLWTLPAAMVIAGAGLGSWLLFQPAHGLPTIGGPFTLVDGDGKTVTEKSLLGHWTLLYFGYTNCPDACPTALQDMADAVDALPAADRSKVRIVFATIDPERDTPAKLKDYVSNFHASIEVWSGTPEQVASAAHAYRVYYAKHKTADGYDMDHSSIIYVINPDGQFVTNFTHETAPKEMSKRLDTLMS